MEYSPVCEFTHHCHTSILTEWSSEYENTFTVERKDFFIHSVKIFRSINTRVERGFIVLTRTTRTRITGRRIFSIFNENIKGRLVDQ